MPAAIADVWQMQGVCSGPLPLFIILAGPSLRQLDLSLLYRRGVVTMAVNNAAAMFRPNYWTCVDPARRFHEAIWRDPAITKFVLARRLGDLLRRKLPNGEFGPIRHGDRDARADDMPGVVGYQRNSNFNPENWLTEPTVNWGNSPKAARRNKHPRSHSVMLVALKLAYVLGFRTVYLLGCDFKMDQDDPAGRYAFTETQPCVGAAVNNRVYAALKQMFTLLRPHFDAAGFRVFNCNPASHLREFPFADFRKAIAEIENIVPQDPLDTDGWYGP